MQDPIATTPHGGHAGPQDATGQTAQTYLSPANFTALVTGICRVAARESGYWAKRDFFDQNRDEIMARHTREEKRRAGRRTELPEASKSPRQKTKQSPRRRP